MADVAGTLVGPSLWHLRKARQRETKCLLVQQVGSLQGIIANLVDQVRFLEHELENCRASDGAPIRLQHLGDIVADEGSQTKCVSFNLAAADESDAIENQYDSLNFPENEFMQWEDAPMTCSETLFGSKLCQPTDSSSSFVPRSDGLRAGADDVHEGLHGATLQEQVRLQVLQEVQNTFVGIVPTILNSLSTRIDAAVGIVDDKLEVQKLMQAAQLEAQKSQIASLAGRLAMAHSGAGGSASKSRSKPKSPTSR